MAAYSDNMDWNLGYTENTRKATVCIKLRIHRIKLCTFEKYAEVSLVTLQANSRWAYTQNTQN